LPPTKFPPPPPLVPRSFLFFRNYTFPGKGPPYRLSTIFYLSLLFCLILFSFPDEDPIFPPWGALSEFLRDVTVLISRPPLASGHSNLMVSCSGSFAFLPKTYSGARVSPFPEITLFPGFLAPSSFPTLARLSMVYSSYPWGDVIKVGRGFQTSLWSLPRT